MAEYEKKSGMFYQNMAVIFSGVVKEIMTFCIALKKITASQLPPK
jgi:hypothetical protein